MSATEIHYNISGQTCRVCLETPQPNEDEAFLCLQDEIEYNDLKVELWQLLEAVSKVKCNWHDSIWPTQMCQNCTRRLILAYEFMREVEKSQQILQELYEHEKLRQGIDTQEAQKEDVQHILEVDGDDIGQTVIESNLVLKNVEQNNIAENVLEISEDGLEEYVQQQNSEVAGPSQLDISQNAIFKCLICQRDFDEKESLEHHIGTAHSQTSILTTDGLPQQTNGNGLLTCKHCPRNFKRQDGLRRHLEAFHPSVLNVPKCAEFINDHDTSKDKRGERTSECTICFKRFMSQNRLTRHLRLHACEKTDKAFVQSNDPTFQRLGLKGERPFQCRICGESFVCRSLLNIHYKQKGHQQQETGTQDPINVVDVLGSQWSTENVEKPHPYKCGVCGLNFKSGALLTVHRNNLSHYNNEEVNYGDPFGESRKKLQ